MQHWAEIVTRVVMLYTGKFSRTLSATFGGIAACLLTTVGKLDITESHLLFAGGILAPTRRIQLLRRICSKILQLIRTQYTA